MLATVIRPSRFFNNTHASHESYASSDIDAAMRNNIYSYQFRSNGIILGCLIVFFSAALLSTELGRIYSGSITYGRNDTNTTFQYLISPNQIIGFNGNVFNPKIENRWIWPWSTATLLFGLIILTTGALGITSGVRQSYSSILTFFIGLILSICLLIFIIATYATILAGWRSIYGTSRSSMPSYVRIDHDFSSGCLAISCVLFIILLVSLILSGRTINACTQKENPRPFYKYGRFIENGTPLLRPRTPQSPRTPRLGAFSELTV